ncbi:MAG TPA: glycosyltransferase [Candidatus Saccharimonadales bacterium]|nr:glycosyltransferase [Candidatus Saccharimonadales bacterium]
MQKKKIDVSIIIVHYHAKKVLFDSIRSIFASSPEVSYEIIIVDNDEKQTINKDLLKLSPKIVYIKSLGNFGFGAGNNLGAQQAKGEYLCFVNPDTLVVDKTIDKLYNTAQKEKKIGIVSAVLLNPKNNEPEILASSTLTPLRAIFSFSFIHTLFPNNPIAKDFFSYNKDIKNTKQTDAVPLGAAMIKRTLFEKIQGFDEKFFLYFEEFDICKRVNELGYKNYISKEAKIIHLGGKGGTERVHNLSSIFLQSRFYYFSKHFGFIPAILTEFVLRLSKYSILFFLSFLVSLFLLTYRLPDLMSFIGDQAWFYMSARDMLLTGHIPLVGITSSHVWLHQSAYWTYMLAGMLWLFHFNPVSGAYFTVLIGLVTMYLIYKIGSEMFSKRVGLISSVFYATSPLIIFNNRMPYHTFPIALLTLLLFYTLFKWTQGLKYGLPFIILLYTLLYNFETATFMLVPIFVLLLIYGFFKKTIWFKDVYNPKLLILSALSWVIIMIPMILYDIHHGYPQTFKFMEWLVYKIVTVFGYPQLHPDVPTETVTTMTRFGTFQLRQLIFLNSGVVAWSILALGFINLIIENLKFIKTKFFVQQYSLLFLFFFIPLVGYIVEKTNSGAYLIVFFPILAFMFGLLVDRVMRIKYGLIPGVLLLLTFVGFNIVTLFQTNYLFRPDWNGFSYAQRNAIAKQIVKESNGKEYNLKGAGNGSQYISFTMSYEYLTWWMGHRPTKKKVPLTFTVQETPTTIILTKEIKKK